VISSVFATALVLLVLGMAAAGIYLLYRLLNTADTTVEN
jgi:ABC-type uncharacterized transport system permease subunit